MKTIQEYRPTPRVIIRPGVLVKFRGKGPEYDDQDGETHHLTLPGLFIVDAVVCKGQRVYLEVTGLKGTFGRRTVFVSGRAYDRHCVTWRPYRIKRVRK